MILGGTPLEALRKGVVPRTYDSRNLLSTISYAGGTIDTRTYDAGGRLSTETLGNGQVVNRTYLTGDNLPLAISNSAVGDYTYAWDANKNKTSETITGTMAPYSSTMAFDDQNRLTTWNRTNGDSQAWTLSAVNDWSSFTNNGTAVARTHGPTHEVLTVGAAAITHDSRGNMTTDEFAITRAYDINNKVSQAVVPTGSVRGIVGTHSYMYDALGRRVRKSIGGSSPSDTVFVHVGEQIYADYTAGAAATSPDKKYVWGSYVDELVCQINGTTKYYIHRNQQYSTTSITAQSGTPAERYGYTSYGDLRTLNPNTLGIRTTPPMTRYTYTGREFDHECGTYHFRARVYSASLGRFTRHDPILYPDGYNTYAGWFAIDMVDPSGWGCKIIYDCKLMSALSDCDDCWYECVEKDVNGRTSNAVGGMIDCSAVPKPHKKYTSRKRGLLGGCDGDFSEDTVYYKNGVPDSPRNCSKSTCRTYCKSGKGFEELCGAFSDGLDDAEGLPKKIGYITKFCETVMKLGGLVCDDFCESWCQKP